MLEDYVQEHSVQEDYVTVYSDSYAHHSSASYLAFYSHVAYLIAF